MSQRANAEPVPDRLVCPNCPADYPPPFSSRRISCRRCGTTFRAPEEARTGPLGSASTTESDRERARSIRSVLPAPPVAAFAFNAAAFFSWIAGIVSFEIAVLTILFVTSTLLVVDAR